MDELWEIIFWMILIGAIIYLISLLLPIILCAVLIYYQGKKIRGQFKKYQLTSTSLMALLAIGFVSFFSAAIAIKAGTFPAYVAIPCSIILFLTLTTLTLGIWATVMLQPLHKIVQDLKREQSTIEGQLTRIKRDLAEQTTSEEQLTSRFKSELEERGKIEDRLNALCLGGDQPRVLITLKERFERETKELPLDKIRARLGAMGNSQDDRGKVIERLVLELEQIGRETSQVHLTLEENGRTLNRLNAQKAETDETIAHLGETIRQKEGDLNNQRVVLN